MTHPHDQRQLQLDLGMAWNGYSPRSLTGAWNRFSFVREGTGRLNPEPIWPHPDQLELFPEGTHYGT